MNVDTLWSSSTAWGVFAPGTYSDYFFSYSVDADSDGDADILAVTRYPEMRYESGKVTRQGTALTTEGTLTLKGRGRPLRVRVERRVKDAAQMGGHGFQMSPTGRAGSRALR